MSNLDATQSSSPGSTYGPGGSPEINAFARRIFFLSVGSAAVPVLFAAGVMLQGGHGLPSKHSLAKFESPTAARPIAAISQVATHNQAPRPATDSPLESRGEVANGATQIHSQPIGGFDAEIARGQSPGGENDIFQRENLVRLAVVSVPTSPGIPDTNSVAVEERNTADRPAVMAVTHAKKIRAETPAHTIARHRHRPQRQTPPSLLAKIGQSVKKGLIEAAKFPREAMAGHRWE